jgi:SAM-dependent methyltransferase
VRLPTFPKRDPGGPEFWDLRYGAGFVPWDAGKVPVQLREFVARCRPRPPRRAEGDLARPSPEEERDIAPPSFREKGVLVPGCGSAWDVRFLAESGWDVLGIDFSPEALAAARAVLGLHGTRVRLADFFAPIAEAPFAFVYERAFLCALPRHFWPAWGARVAQLVAPGGQLAGFFFFGDEARGPPFPLHSQDELAALLEPAFERIEDAPAHDSIPVFAGRERWQVWRRRENQGPNSSD